jgi:hypothetical protein
VEQSKVPDYLGQKAKDTISALNFIHCIDDLTRTNNWNDMVTYNNFANTLRSLAQKWLFFTVDMLQYTADQLTWTNLKPRLQVQFAFQSNDTLIIEGLSNLAMMKELTCNLLNRVTNVMVIIKESYAAYQNKVQALLKNANGSYLTATAEKYKNNAVNNTIQFFKMQLFQAALPGKLHNMVVQKDQTTIT